MSVYLDFNAGAPLRPAAAAAMREAMDALAQGGNPSSPHAGGRAVRAIVERARDAVCALLEADPDEVIFTSGATEAANTVLAGQWDLVLRSGLEHDCVVESIRAPVRVIATSPDGVVRLDSLEALLREGPASPRRLVALTGACGETGALQPVAVAARMAREAGAAFFCDATQLPGRAPFSFRELGIDFAAVSASKLGGPPGVGALLVRSDRAVPRLLFGGGQEARRRAGTENVVGVAGFGAAALAAAADDWSATRRLRDRMETALLGVAPGARLYGDSTERLPNVSCVGFPSWSAEELVVALDLRGFAVGAGSACSSGRAKPGRALVELGFGEAAARSAIRVGIRRDEDAATLDGFVDTVAALVTRHARLAA